MSSHFSPFHNFSLLFRHCSTFYNISLDSFKFKKSQTQNLMKDKKVNITVTYWSAVFALVEVLLGLWWFAQKPFKLICHKMFPKIRRKISKIQHDRFCKVSATLMLSWGSSTVVKHLTHHPKVEGSSFVIISMLKLVAEK
jgi:hypothetical protein